MSCHVAEALSCAVVPIAVANFYLTTISIASTLESVKGTNPLLQTTISDIETRQDPHRGKIPWLIAMIKDFTPSEIDAAVTLMDPSGEMRGTIHISVLEQYKNNEIRIGTVLVLNNVSFDLGLILRRLSKTDSFLNGDTMLTTYSCCIVLLGFCVLSDSRLALPYHHKPEYQGDLSTKSTYGY